VLATRGKSGLVHQLLQPVAIGARPGDRQRQQHVFLRGQHRQQVEELKDEADVLTSQEREPRVVERRDLGPRDRNAAARRRVEAGEAMHQRRLSRPGRAHHRHQMPALHVQRYASEGSNRRRSLAVPTGHVVRHDNSATLVCLHAVPDYTATKLSARR